LEEYWSDKASSLSQKEVFEGAVLTFLYDNRVRSILPRPDFITLFRRHKIIVDSKGNTLTP
jgi:hypothetical protein